MTVLFKRQKNKLFSHNLKKSFRLIVGTCASTVHRYQLRFSYFLQSASAASF